MTACKRRRERTPLRSPGLSLPPDLAGGGPRSTFQFAGRQGRTRFLHQGLAGRRDGPRSGRPGSFSLRSSARHFAEGFDVIARFVARQIRHRRTFHERTHGYPGVAKQHRVSRRSLLPECRGGEGGQFLKKCALGVTCARGGIVAPRQFVNNDGETSYS